jgi:hypothetical protein
LGKQSLFEPRSQERAAAKGPLAKWGEYGRRPGVNRYGSHRACFIGPPLDRRHQPDDEPIQRLRCSWTVRAKPARTSAILAKYSPYLPVCKVQAGPGFHGVSHGFDAVVAVWRAPYQRFLNYRRAGPSRRLARALAKSHPQMNPGRWHLKREIQTAIASEIAKRWQLHYVL